MLAVVGGPCCCSHRDFCGSKEVRLGMEGSLEDPADSCPHLGSGEGLCRNPCPAAEGAASAYRSLLRTEVRKEGAGSPGKEGRGRGCVGTRNTLTAT